MTDKFKPPSNTDSPFFEATNQQPSIQPFATRSSSITRHHPLPEATEPARVSDLAHIAHILSILSPNALKVSDPIPTKSSSLSPLSSPPKNTPTKLCRFLEHAETDLGVADATSFLYWMENKGYGPDILYEVPNGDLKELGVKPGDVLRLKRGAPAWFNGPNAKRKHSEPQASGSGATISATRTCFEKRWPDGFVLLNRNTKAPQLPQNATKMHKKSIRLSI